MDTVVTPDEIEDAQLVARCLAGDRATFSRIVERHQVFVCALAYSGCGNSHQSEEIAQETFLTAWQQLPSLREPDKLKPWLGGICRHLVNASWRRNQRVPTSRAEPLDEETIVCLASPREQAIDREEEAMLWLALEHLPALYREPMICFYRQQESVSAVASALDLSPAVVKQRLARGRTMLAAHVERRLRVVLSKSAPTKVFTLTVMAALPVGLNTAKAASVGIVAIKGGAVAKGALGVGFLSGLMAPLAAVAGTYFERRARRNSSHAASERIFNDKLHLLTGLAGASIVLVMIVAGLLNASVWHAQPAQLNNWMIVTVAVLLSALLALFIRLERQRRECLATCATSSSSPRADDRPGDCRWDYVSKKRLLGLPLVHIRLGGNSRQPVQAWVAAGNRAYGVLFAAGGVAVSGGISLGGLAVGGASFGGAALGILSFGGAALGWGSVGGLAIGWMAVGGGAIAWKAARCRRRG